MNFGVKITLLYIGFVALILTLVVMSFNQNVELVSKDYYAQEIAFQDKIISINNEKSLNGSINHEINGNQITLTIDSTICRRGIKGTIVFFRPSDSSKDIKIKMDFNNGTQIINEPSLIHGAYKLQLSWVSNHTNYFKEEVIFIN